VSVSTAATVHEVAQDLLEASVLILNDTIGGPVELAYLSPGLPSLDFQCDQLAVWVAALGDEATSPLAPIPVVGQRRRMAWTNLAVFSVMAARCVRVGNVTKGGYEPPTIYEVSGDARKTMEDGWALWNGVSTAIINDGLFGGTCTDIKFVSMTPLSIAGGMAGWVLTISAELAGYR
jgi:hypothetical protein